MMRGGSQQQTAARRRGVSAVEFAVVLPFLGLLVFGIVEFGRALTVRQALNDAVRKACRTGSLPNRTTANIVQEAQDILTDNGISPADATVTVKVNGTVADASTALRNDRVTVQVSVPFSKVSWGPAVWLTGSAAMSADLTMQRQG